MKKKIIFLSIFIFVLLLGGVGIYYYTQSHRDSVTFANTEARFKTYTEKAPSDGSLPTDHDAYKNIAYVLWNIEHTENFSSVTRGSAVSVGQHQTIYNHRIVNGDKQLVDTISGGLVTLGKQKFFKDGKVLLRDFVSQDGDNITWKTDDPECITYAGYIKRYGWLPTQSTAYIICNETILDISEVQVLDDGTYSIHLSLNPNWDYAPFWYRREVAENASSLEEPIFSSIELDYIFDASWRCLEVKTKEKYTVKPKVAPIKVDCTTDISEIFNYEDASMPEDALNYFKNFEDMKPSDGEVVLPTDDTPLSYITGSLMGGEAEKTFQLRMDYQDKQIEGVISLNISDLNHIVVKLKVDDFILIYEGDTIYLSYGNTKIKGNVKEVENMLTPLLRQIILGDGSKPAGNESSFDLNQIMNDLNAGTVEKDGNHVQVQVTLSMLGIKLPILFDISINGMSYELNSIESKLEWNEYCADISLKKTDSIEFESVDPNDYQDLKNLNFIVEDLTAILESKKAEIDFQATISDVSIAGVMLIDFKDHLAIAAALELKYQDQVEKINLYYAQNMLYLDFHNQKFKISVEDLKGLLASQLQLPEQSQQDLFELLSKLDLKSILKQLELKENALSIILNLPKLGILDAVITDTEQGFDIQSSQYDFMFSLNAHTTNIIELQEDEYVDLKVYFDSIKELMDLIGKKSIGIKLAGTIGKEASFQGYVDLILIDGQYQLVSTIQLSYQNQQLDLKFWMKNNYIYVSFLNQTFCFNKDTFVDSFTKILDKVGISIALPQLPEFDQFSALGLLSSLHINENSIRFDLSNLNSELKELLIEIAHSDNLNVHIQFDQIVDCSIQIQEIESYEFRVPEQYMTEEQVLQLMDYASDILTMIQNKHGSISFQLKIEDTPVTGEAYVEWINGFKMRIDLSVFDMDFTLYYLDDTLYINYNEQMKIKIQQDKLGEFLALLLPDSPAIDFSSSQLIDYIEEFFNHLTFEENKISTMLQIVGLPNIIVSFIQTDLGFDIQMNLYDLFMRFESDKTMDILVQADEYSDTSLYFDFITYLLSIEQAGAAKLTIDASYSLELNGKTQKIEVSGVADILYHSDTKQVDMAAILDISMDTMQLDVSIYLIDQQLYIGVLDQVVSIFLNELPQWLEKWSIEQPNTEFSALAMLVPLLETLWIGENQITFSLEQLQSGFQDCSIVFGLDELTGASVDVQAQPLSLSLSILLAEPKTIVAPEVTISSEELFSLLDAVVYLKHAIYKESIHLEIPEAVLVVENEEICFNGAIDFVLNTAHQYEIEGNISLSFREHEEFIHFIWKEEQLYLTLLNQTIYLSKAEISDLMLRIKELMGENPTDSLDFDIASLGFKLTEQLLEIDLSSLLNVLFTIRIAYNYQNESLLHFSSLIEVNYDRIYLSLPIELSKSNKSEIVLPSGEMLTYSDLLEWLEQISYLIQLYKKGSVHLDLAETEISIMHLEQTYTITVQGSFDLLLKPTLALTGYLDMQGLGLSGRIAVTLMEKDLYVSLLGQTIHLNLDSLQSFMDTCMSRIQQVVSLDSMPTTDRTQLDFELSFNSNSLEVIFKDLIRISCWMNLIHIEDPAMLNVMLQLSADSFIDIPNLSLMLSESTVEKIDAPKGDYLEEQDLLMLLDDFISIYQLKDLSSAGIDFSFDIIQNNLKKATLSGYLEFKLLDKNEFDAQLDLYIREYDAKGNSKAWHQLHVSVLSASTMAAWNQTSEAMIFATYGNMESDTSALLKLQSTYTGIENLIQSILKLIQMDSILPQDISSNLFHFDQFISYLNVDQNQLEIHINANALFPMMEERQNLELIFAKDELGICGISGNNIYLSYTNQFNSMALNSLHLSLERNKEVNIFGPEDLDSYKDVSNCSYLFEALYNNALERDFEIQGKLELQALSIIKKEIGVLIQIHVEENGEPTLYARLDIPNVPFMLSKKLLHIYYANQYIYIYREDSTAKDSKQIKLHYSVFMENLVYYLLDFGMGMPDMVLNQINNSSNKGKGYVNAANCVTALTLGQNSFHYGLNLGEIADNSDLGNLNLTIESSMVTKLDENNNEIIVPMIHKITEFSFDMVSVIKLTLAKGSALTLSNIVESDSKLSIQELDFKGIYDFVQQYSFEEDKEYSFDGTNWVEGKAVSHTATFINEFASETIQKEYVKDEAVDFPSYDILTVSNEVYQMDGWYYDDAFKLPVLEAYIMGNRNVTFYAKMNKITSKFTIIDDYGSPEAYYQTYEKQSLDELYQSYQNQLLSLENRTFRFTHFEILLGEEWVLFAETIAEAGNYQLKACYEEIYYTAYLVETNQTIRLSYDSQRVLLAEAYVQGDHWYYGYRNETLTDYILLSEYLDYFDDNNQIRIYSAGTLHNQYQFLSWDCSNVNGAYNDRSYNALAYQVGTSVEELLPNGVTDYYEINAWVDENGLYYAPSDFSSSSQSLHLKPFIANKTELFTFSEASLTGYTGGSQVGNVILPRYYKNDLNQIVSIHTIGENAFKDQNDIATVVISEGYESIAQHAFQNAKGLREVYMPSTLTRIDNEVFLYDYGSSFETRRDENAVQLRLYYLSEQQNNQFGKLTACYANYLFGKKYVYYGEKTTGSWPADLSQTFQYSNRGSSILNVMETILSEIL